MLLGLLEFEKELVAGWSGQSFRAAISTGCTHRRTGDDLAGIALPRGRGTQTKRVCGTIRPSDPFSFPSASGGISDEENDRK